MFQFQSWRRRGAVLLAAALAIGALIPASAGASNERTRFALNVATPNLLPCLAEYPDDPQRPPTAEVTVERGELNDTLHLRLRHFKPNLNFDMFTVQRSRLDANGTPVNPFTNFGLAWYQSDVHVDQDGDGNVTVKTILLDQIFGFDPDVNLQPLNTFHVGFWFNDPADATNCVGQVVTPFNGEHKAGPLAFISVPDAATNLGPLCINPDTSKTPVACNP
jgi:hypothetical protein